MKKFLFALITLFASTSLATTTYTTNFNLAKPGDGDTNWGSLLRDNLDTIDTQLQVSDTGLSDHLADTTGAHAATAISTAVGGATCTSADDVQEFLECLDSNFGTLTGGNVATTNTTQTITGAKTFSSLITGSAGLSVGGSVTFSVLPSNGPVINSSGVLSSEAQLNASRGGTGVDGSTATNGYTLIGNGTGFTLAGLTGTSNQITVTNGSGTITLSAPQNIHTAATPTFASVTGTTSLILQDPGAGTDTVTLQAPTLSGAYTLTMPTDDGSSDQLLKTNGSGTLSWTDPLTAASTYNAYSADQTLSSVREQFVTCSGSGTDITLFACAAGTSGYKVIVKRNDSSNACTIKTDATGTQDRIDGSTSDITMAINNQSIMLVCDGSDDWFSHRYKPAQNWTTVSSGPYTVLATDDVIGADPSSASFTINLPPVSSNDGREITIVRTNSASALDKIVTIDGDGSETIDGSTTIKLSTFRDNVTLQAVASAGAWVTKNRFIRQGWTAYTPTITTATGTMTNYTASGYWKRNGEMIDVNFKIVFSGDGGTFTQPRVSVPSGLTISGTPMMAGSNGYKIIGDAHFEDFGVANYHGVTLQYSTSAIEVAPYLTSGTYPSSTAAGGTVPFDIENQDSIAGSFSIHITEWSN